MKDNEEQKQKESLWDQLKGLYIVGERLSGEPEILHEIEDALGNLALPISRAQIQILLENVPNTFPEKWKNPGSFKKLSSQEQQVGLRITGANPIVPIYGETIEEIIKLAVEYRDKYGKSQKSEQKSETGSD